GHQVHGDATDDVRRDAIDQYRRAGRRVARVAVAVADGGDADAAVAFADVVAAVADAITGAHVLHRDQPRVQAHRRLEAEVGTGPSLNYGPALPRAPRTHPGA